MDPIPCASIILVVADSNFVNLCKDPVEYVNLLKERVVTNRKGDALLYTVTGKYGISNIDKEMPTLDVEDRNKTLFSQTLENSTMLFDELMVISVNENDPFILAAKEVVTTASKTSTHYKYPRK
ncbi:hypothetical protein D3C85_1391760 [compost metagenome]|jgi:hypothetical protein